MVKIKNKKDLLKHFEAETEALLHKYIYKYTECGAWIKLRDNGFTIGTIVEGSDAEFSQDFYYPVVAQEVDDWIEGMEELALDAWIEANDYQMEMSPELM